MKDKMNFKKFLQMAWMLFALANMLLWIPKVDGILSKEYGKVSRYVLLDDGWEITVNGEVFSDVALEGFSFEPIQKGGKIVAKRMLPEDFGMAEGALRLSIRHCAVRVYIDGAQIYEYGYDRMAQNRSVGSGLLFVNCPSVYQGKELTIEYCLVERRAIDKLLPVRLYPWENVYKSIMTENRIPALIGSFLVIFGVITCVITMFTGIFSLKYLKMLCISLFSIFIGLWTLCYYEVLQVFAVTLDALSALEYTSLYLTPLPLIVYVYEDVKKIKYKWFRMLYWITAAVIFLSLAAIMTLHALNIVHLAEMLSYAHMLLLGCMSYFAGVVFLNIKNGKLLNKLYLIALFIICCCVAYDLIGYNAYLAGSNAELSLKGASSISAMTLVIVLFIDFYIEMTRKMMQEAERHSLIRRAYTDELTTIHNRRYCMEYMEKIKNKKNYDFTVVCFDLNDLKKVNDTYGHAKGDILIKCAAEAIAGAFEENGIVARMGGDEFIAVVNTAKEEKIQELIGKFLDNVKKANEKEQDLNMTIAWGYVSGKKGEMDIEQAYHVADDRMYACKRQQKGGAPKNA